MPETGSPSGDSGVTRPVPALLHRHSRYQVPTSLFQGHGDIDEYTRSVMVSTSRLHITITVYLLITLKMAQFLYRRLQEHGWLQPDKKAEIPASLGIVLQVEHEQETKFIVEPQTTDDNVKTICSNLNLGAVFTMSSDLTHLFFTKIGKDDFEITLSPNNVTVPVVDSLQELARDGAGVRRRDFCCFVRKERLVLVWSNTADGVMLHGGDVDSKLMSSVSQDLLIAFISTNVSEIWGAHIPVPETPPTPYHNRSQGLTLTPGQQRTPSIFSNPSVVEMYNEEKNLAIIDEIDLGAEDEESLEAPARPFLLTHSVMVGLAMCLLMVIECLAVRLIVIEVHALGTVALPRLALLTTLPIFMFFTLFFTIVVIGTVFQLLGPVNDVKLGNSRFYSSRAPDIKRHPNIDFPHITIQMPVYKEGLKGVIIPTINSLLGAIRHYEKLGGTASIYVCEDGMQALKPEVSEMRQRFYRANNIGWCARPAHGKDGFIRAGKFKKASNMNYCLSFSLRVEDELLRLMAEKSAREGRSTEDFSVEEESTLYDIALQTIIDADGGKTLADGNVRMGDIILIVDCDTRVVSFCLSLPELI